MDTEAHTIGEEAEEVAVLPGFRFHPTDQELVGFYLRRKVEKKPIRIDFIRQVDIYKYDPWDLPRVSNVGDKEWFFFCLRGRKYRNSIRPNRVTVSGFWKATGIDRPVHSTAGGDSHDYIGLKKSLVYYRGSAGKGTKTDWMMHEFRLPISGKNVPVVSDGSCIPEAESWTICRIFKRAAPCNKKQQLLSRQLAPSSESVSKTSTSTTHDEWKHPVITYTHEDTKSNNSVVTYLGDTESNNSVITSYYEAGESTQICAGAQWNPAAAQAAAPSVATQPTTEDFCSTPNPNEFVFDDGSWDELGRIVEFSVDPSLAHEYCRYSLYS
ncbi:hypothetical protein Taro_049033 [Colocasia esculenta]|uniref:NAC domain-containing protein n=1 Tax=Colocasia esculenta TaxID=4460 RepID=A0A843X9R7_COLES|nr:hypothetical protein [Colocasia esculenta]